MKIRLIILFFSIFFHETTGQSWQLLWSDEFNGNTLDTNKWIHDIGSGSQNGMWGWGNGELQYYQPQNTVVSNGTLKIIAKNEPNGILDTWNNPFYYSSSRTAINALLCSLFKDSILAFVSTLFLFFLGSSTDSINYS